MLVGLLLLLFMAVVMCGKKSEKWKMENGAGSDLEVTASWEMKGAGGGVCGGGGGVQTVRTDRRTGCQSTLSISIQRTATGFPSSPLGVGIWRSGFRGGDCLGDVRACST